MLAAAALLGISLLPMTACPQTAGYVKQVLTVNSGKFEYSPPFTDFVSLQSYNPQTQSSATFGSIGTQSGQAILIIGRMAYVAAQDSIVKYNLSTMERMFGVADSGLNRLAVCNGKLIVSKQYPSSAVFAEVLDTATLAPVAYITGLSGDCAGITGAADSVYIAVNGGWMGTQGKLAVIDPATWTLRAEIPLGPEAIGINDLYHYNGKVVAVNKTPYGSTTGSITVYNPAGRSFITTPLSHTVGMSAGILDSLLYVGIDYGIGSFNLNTRTIQQQTLVPDPGSSLFRYFTSMTIDTFNRRIYANVGDYVQNGYCLVSSVTGDSLTTYSTGISSDAVAVDYRQYPAGLEGREVANDRLRIFPNPVGEMLCFETGIKADKAIVTIRDVAGRAILTGIPGQTGGYRFGLPAGTLKAGIYLLTVDWGEGSVSSTFVKR